MFQVFVRVLCVLPVKYCLQNTKTLLSLAPENCSLISSASYSREISSIRLWSFTVTSLICMRITFAVLWETFFPPCISLLLPTHIKTAEFCPYFLVTKHVLDDRLYLGENLGLCQSIKRKTVKELELEAAPENIYSSKIFRLQIQMYVHFFTFCFFDLIVHTPEVFKSDDEESEF